MTIQIRQLDPGSASLWDAYVLSHPDSTLYHLSGWAEVIKRSYGHHVPYLMAWEEGGRKVVGVLPMAFMKHPMFGRKLVSVPFFDLGGVLADEQGAEQSLVTEAVRMADSLGADSIELRHREAHSWLDAWAVQTGGLHMGRKSSQKVRMVLDLPESSEVFLKSLKSKLRSQIKVPIREGLTARVGGGELVDEFYHVFSVNMRDLGSPVHSRSIVENAVSRFSDTSRIVVVYREGQPVASSIMIGYRDIMENPWASSLRRYSRLSPNMLLYWTMLEYACDNGYRYFDFGRSSVGEGTFKFKEQWGAHPQPLEWQYVLCCGEAGLSDERSKFEWAVNLWMRLPVSITKVIGPRLRKHIAL